MRDWPWRTAASLLFYSAVAAVIGRHVLAHPGSHIANDLGDPLLTAAILQWNATHVPLTEAWYQLPIFFPAANVLTLSEHLLGLSVLASPLEWLSGNPLTAYNATMLLTAVLSAGAAYALTFWLTRDAIAAFVAGLAFGFAPYRVSQFPHVQMLASFYAPLALLGLHAYLDTGKRRWLVLYGAGWFLQAATNGYMLVFFSILVALWVAWFVIARGRWRALVAITTTTVVAVLPLVPILVRYLRVHQFHGFTRGIDEIRMFSADMGALLCAPGALTFWGWLRINCGPEGELFPGVALAVLCTAAALRILAGKVGPEAAGSPSRAEGTTVPATGDASRPSRTGPVRLVRHALTLVLSGMAVTYFAIAVTVAWLGPWHLTIGPASLTASRMGKPLVIAVLALLAVVFLRPAVRAAIRQWSALAFYLLAGAVMWLFALGPRPRLNGTAVEFDGPFAWLMLLPGGDSLRVPSRFWLLATLCLAVGMGLFVARLLKARPRRTRLMALGVLTIALLTDSWAVIPAQAVRPAGPNPAALAGRTVLEIPMSIENDIAASYHAITGGWSSVNGYSGFFPLHYLILRAGIAAADDAIWEPLRARGDVAVVVSRDALESVEWIRRQPGVTVTGADEQRIQFLLPARHRRAHDGTPLAIQAVMSTCNTFGTVKAHDASADTEWVCGAMDAEQTLTIDLGLTRPVGALMHGSATGVEEYPRAIRIDTSVDGQTWEPAWAGTTTGAAIDAALADPRLLRLWFVFQPRPARYVRLTHPAGNADYTWSVADVAVAPS